MNKFDLLYPYHFDKNDTDAITRLKSSILSLIDQDVNICVCNTANHFIYNDIKELKDIRYLHKPTNDNFNKPKTINIGVKEMIKTEYFIMSDIDLVYHPEYVETVSKYADGENIRVININYNCPYKHNSPFYNEYFDNVGGTNGNRPWQGESRGNGLVKRSAFMRIGGFDEFYYGFAPEDLDFNVRIAMIKKPIITDDVRITTVHINHPQNIGDGVQLKKNHDYFDKKFKEMEERAKVMVKK
jgi:hypothetical protein